MTVRKRFEWKLKSRSLPIGDRTLIMGILNLTPDSFSDGARYSEPDRAYARALELEEQGADIIDIGAESTKPGSARITEDEEINRLIPVLKRLEGKLSIPVSVDTYKAAIAQRAVDLGVEIINDPSGLTFEPDLAKVVMNADAGLVLNHMRGTPDSWAKLPPQPDVAGATLKDLEATVSRAVRAGIDKRRIVIDPGLGFGKRKEQNFELLARLAEFGRLDLPVLVGPSRKQFLARDSEQETAYANAAAIAAAILNGAQIVRVHEVREMLIAAQIADAILTAMPEPVEPERERPARDRSRPLRSEDADRPGNRPVRPPTSRPAAAGAVPIEIRPAASPEAEEPEVEQLELEPLVEAGAESPDEEAPAEVETPAAAPAPPPPATPPPAAERPRNLPLRAAAPKRAPSERPAAGGDRPYRPRRDQPSEGAAGDRPYRPRRDDAGESRGAGDRPFRPGRDRGDDRPREDRPPRSAPRDRGEKPTGPPWARKPERGDRPAGPPRGKSGGYGDRPDRPSGPPRDRSGDRDRTDRPSGPPWARGDRPSGPPRGKPSDRGDRPAGPPRGRSSDYGDRPAGPPRGRGGDYGDRPAGPPRGRSSDYGDRPAGPPRGKSSDRGERPAGPPRGGSKGGRPSGPPRGGSGGKGKGGRPSGPPRGRGGPKKRG